MYFPIGHCYAAHLFRGALLHLDPLLPLGSEPTMAQDSLVSPHNQWERDRVPQTRNSGRNHQRLFFMQRMSVTVTCFSYTIVQVLCLLFSPSLLHTYSVHTYSILLISSNLHLYLLWKPSRQSRHFAISPSVSVSPPQFTPLSPFSPILHTFIHCIHSPLIESLPMWKHRPSSRSDSTGPFDLHHQPSSSSPRNWFGRSKKKSPLCK